MKKTNLNVLRFTTESGNEYIYDNESGMVFPCSDALYDTIENFLVLSKDEILNKLHNDYNLESKKAGVLYNHIKKLVNNGCIYECAESETSQKVTEKDIYETALSQLILIVTEDCNIRCKYCIYSDNYPHVKTYTKEKMSFEVAQKAIDYYIELHQIRIDSGFRRKPIITFYGGEPLLEFELIKKVVEYCKYNMYDVIFFATTNATVMTDEMIDFIVENNIVITFSLDGYKYNNDRNRVFPNGKGTHDIIMRNITKLQNEKRKRGIEHVISFSCCYDSHTDMCEVVKFFDDNHDLFYPYTILFSQISKYDTDYYTYCEKAYEAGMLKDNNETFSKTVNILQQNFLDSVISGEEIKSVAMQSLFMGIKFILWRTKGKFDYRKLPCTPGSKIAVAPNGEFYVCERVSQTCSIGNIDTKIDFDKVNKLVKKYDALKEKNCKNCSVSRLCTMCFMHLAKEDDLEFNYQLCHDNQRSIPASLKIVFSVLEKNPNAFDLYSADNSDTEIAEIKSEINHSEENEEIG